MANSSVKSADDLVQTITSKFWSAGEIHKFNLDKYHIDDTTLPAILQKIRGAGLEYELSKSSSGKSTLKVYAPSTSSTSEMVRSMAACFLFLISIFPISLIFMLLMVFVYPLFTIATKLADDRWISLEDFYNSYWEFLSDGDY